ncbi:hypothetical protein FA95DRAFT_350868 [Auriscalpium vulgare]|uniref:Uncharacterized protein n=1 Tax=Auriscalpium vulgare TaxID=40419 RepID=A0ACB8S5L1_9AGAM|nr:hypothetical protein FA95DRAFT_350868 [Auriscalpium vulgare]
MQRIRTQNVSAFFPETSAPARRTSPDFNIQSSLSQSHTLATRPAVSGSAVDVDGRRGSCSESDIARCCWPCMSSAHARHRRLDTVTIHRTRKPLMVPSSISLHSPQIEASHGVTPLIAFHSAILFNNTAALLAIFFAEAPRSGGRGNVHCGQGYDKLGVWTALYRGLVYVCEFHADCSINR